MPELPNVVAVVTICAAMLAVNIIIVIIAAHAIAIHFVITTAILYMMTMPFLGVLLGLSDKPRVTQSV